MTKFSSKHPGLITAFVISLTFSIGAHAQGGGPGRGMGGNMPAFAEYDLNGDGKIVEQEFDEARAKRISERAQQGYRMRNAADAPSFKAIDQNGDGTLGAEEFSAHQSQRIRGR